MEKEIHKQINDNSTPIREQYECYDESAFHISNINKMPLFDNWSKHCRNGGHKLEPSLYRGNRKRPNENCFSQHQNYYSEEHEDNRTFASKMCRFSNIKRFQNAGSTIHAEVQYCLDNEILLSEKTGDQNFINAKNKKIFNNIHCAKNYSSFHCNQANSNETAYFPGNRIFNSETASTQQFFGNNNEFQPNDPLYCKDRRKNLKQQVNHDILCFSSDNQFSAFENIKNNQNEYSNQHKQSSPSPAIRGKKRSNKKQKSNKKKKPKKNSSLSSSCYKKMIINVVQDHNSLQSTNKVNNMLPINTRKSKQVHINEESAVSKGKTKKKKLKDIAHKERCRRALERQKRAAENRKPKGEAKRPTAGFSKTDPPTYWTAWWPNYAHVEHAIAEFSEADLQLIEADIKFVYQPDDPKFLQRKQVLLNMGLKKMRRTLDIAESNYQYRDVLKLFIQKRHLEDVNFQQHLDAETLKSVQNVLQGINAKQRVALLYQSLIYRWTHSKDIIKRIQQGENLKGRHANNLLNDKVFNYYVLDCIRKLKEICSNEWKGFNDYYAKLQENTKCSDVRGSDCQ